MNTNIEENTNPGQQLKLILERLHPLKENVSFLSKLDDTLMAEGDFTKVVYNSSINYMIRRLINTAEFLKRKYNQETYQNGKFEIELRLFLKEYTRIPKSEIERVFILLLECLKQRGREVSDMTKRKILKEARAKGLRCYICGCQLDFIQNGLDESADVEHVWPKTLGGSSDIHNLKISCLRCNRIKSDYIDSNDFHYEKISLISNVGDRNFLAELTREYRVILWLRSDCSCVVCRKQALTEGQLRLARRELNDSWHFMNIEAYCNQHAPE